MTWTKVAVGIGVGILAVASFAQRLEWDANKEPEIAVYTVNVYSPATNTTPTATNFVTNTFFQIIPSQINPAVTSKFAVVAWGAYTNAGTNTVTYTERIVYAATTNFASMVAGQVYYVFSNEINGGDDWYDSDQTLTENGGNVSQMNAAFIDPSSGQARFNPGKSYVPVSFVSFGNAGGPSAVTNRLGGTVRADFTGLVGFQFTAPASGFVVQLGRWVRPGNTNVHVVELRDSNLKILASAPIITANALISTTNVVPPVVNYVASKESTNLFWLPPSLASAPTNTVIRPTP